MVRLWLVSLGLIAAAVLVYAPARDFDFVSWDDPEYVTQNVHVRQGLSIDGVVWAFTTGDHENWHPLVALSHMLDCEICGIAPAGHHLSNIVLHVLNVLLLFGVLHAMTGAIWQCAWVAALFAVHPLNVEAVAWVSARKDVLSTLLGLLAMAAYVAYARRGGIGRYLLSAALLALGLMAKPMLVTLPLVFLLLDYWPLGRLRIGGARTEAVAEQARMRRSLGHLLLEKLPLLALSVASSIVTYAVLRQRVVVPSTFRPVPFELRAANAVVSYVRYLAQALWPTDLAILYPHPNLPGGTPWSAGQVIGAAVLLVVISAAVLWARRQRYLLVGWLWYLGTLVPVIGLMQVSADAMADRYTYLPMIGIFIAVVWGAAELTGRVGRRHALPRAAMGAAAVVVLVALMACAARQVSYWRDSIALYEHALEVAPGTAIMRTNLANVLTEKGRIDEAIEHYRLAVEVDPDYLPAHNNLGNMLMFRSQPNEAVQHYSRAVALAPNLPHTHINLADTLIVLGRIDEAIAHYERALALDARHMGADRTRLRLADARRLRQLRGPGNSNGD
jgi:tetratricopeptide (TPR) repeat protein